MPQVNPDPIGRVRELGGMVRAVAASERLSVLGPLADAVTDCMLAGRWDEAAFDALLSAHAVFVETANAQRTPWTDGHAGASTVLVHLWGTAAAQGHGRVSPELRDAAMAFFLDTDGLVGRFSLTPLAEHLAEAVREGDTGKRSSAVKQIVDAFEERSEIRGTTHFEVMAWLTLARVARRAENTASRDDVSGAAEPTGAPELPGAVFRSTAAATGRLKAARV